MIYDYTLEEMIQVKESYFSSLDPVVLSVFPAKEKKKYIALQIIKTVFQPNITYTEKEVSSILKEVYFDFVTLRRYLVDYHYLLREKDGSAYWVNEELI
ncbi:MAG: DUF2087 domain-containing protein [Candidatus Izemoplasmatales bacterium]